MELRSIMDLLWKRRGIMLFIFLVIFITIVGVSRLITPWYNASASVLLAKPGDAYLLLDSLEVEYKDFPSTIGDSDISNQIALASLPSLGMKVIEDLSLTRKKIRYQLFELLPFSSMALKILGIEESDTRKRLAIREFVGSSSLAIFFPRPHVEVSQFQDSNLLEIRAVSTDFEEAVRIANAMADAMVAAEVSRSQQEFTTAAQFIEGKMVNAHAEAIAARNAVQRFVIDNKALDLATEKSTLATTIADLKQSINDNEADASDTGAKIGRIKSRLGERPMLRESSRTAESLLKTRLDTLQNLQLSLAEARTQYTDEHPTVVSLLSKISILEKNLKENPEQVAGDETISVDPVYQALEESLTESDTLLATVDNKRERLPAFLAKHEKLIPNLVQKYDELVDLQRLATITKSTYESLDDLLRKIRIVETLAVSSISVVEHALLLDPSGEPAQKHPRLIFSIFIAILLGTSFSITIALFLAYIGDTVGTVADLEQVSNLALLGSIPKLRWTECKNILAGSGSSPGSESVRLIRNAICFKLEKSGGKSCVLTSVGRGEGKSFLSLGVAVSAARSGKRVLLLDANLKHPVLHSLIKNVPDKGLADFLEDRASEEEIFGSTLTDGLHVVTAGSFLSPVKPLLESPKLGCFIEFCKARYDLLVFDSPAFKTSCDNIFLAKWADAAVIIVEDGVTPRPILRELVDSLQSTGIQLLGTVFNKVVSLPSFSGLKRDR